MKKIYLSPLEQEVYGLLRKNSSQTISSDAVKGLFPEKTPSSLNKICSHLAQKGYLYRLKRNLYLIQDIPSEKPIINDPILLAQQIFPGYISFLSALRIYDLIDYEPFTIFVATKEKSIELHLGEYLFKYISLGEKARGTTHHKGVYISTLEKTFFDCFCRPQNAGGYSTLTKAFYLNKKIDWKTFTSYFQRYSSNTLHQRTGYVLDLLATKTDKKIPVKVLNYFHGKQKTKARLLPIQKTRGTYNRKWGITDNLGPKNILSWW
ncbi:MAG: hypothetical protein ABH950_09625 [Candidatus Altiarchaeota archaeon]